MQNWLFFLAVETVVLVCTVTNSSAQVPGTVLGRDGKLAYVANDPAYRAYASLTGRADDPNRVHTDLFAPLVSQHDDLLFADVRGQFLYGGGAEGNLGLAYRHMFDNSFIVGTYGFYDVKRSTNENTFHQAAFGIELLSDLFDARWNGYIPEGGSAHAAQATAVVSGGNLVVQNNTERAYYGTDAEVGMLLWRLPQWCDSEVRAFAGGYHFDTNSPTANSISGPRIRAELRSFDLPFLAIDSRMTVGFQYQYDSVRHSQTAATIGIRMPFGLDRHRRRKMTHLERRMTDVIVRDVDVVAAVTPTPNGQETAVHAIYEFEIGSVTVLDARTDDLPNAVATATTDSVIIDGGSGNLELDEPIEVQLGQQLLAGGLRVKGADTGIQAKFGTPIKITGTDDTKAVILTADHSIISGFDIYGGKHGISSDLPGGLDDLIGVLIFSNNVSDAADSGFRFGTLDPLSVIAHNRSTGNGNHGFDIELNEGEFYQNNSLGNVGNGFDLFDNDGEVTLNRSLRNEGFGFYAGDNSGKFNLNEAYENDASGFDFADNNGEINNNLSADNGLQGFTFAANNGTVKGNAAFDNGSLGFDFVDNNGTIQENLAFDNGSVGFDFADNYGDFLDNSSSGNGLVGYFFNNNYGNVLRNTANLNGDEGFFFTDNIFGGVFSGNTASVNGDVGFLFSNNDGDFVDNVADANGLTGFRFAENSGTGTFEGNSADFNGDLGYEGVNNGTASANTGTGNVSGGDSFP
ncbi:right-handed parallel beta-helix repeat-containing protein [Neorhodopirellula pilleata]|uniref:right-handed parallel beta-helix repeat-containing protein n=1 Tax=Neorhodopirellula pilleata TaxID=2714738 RepID=UPI0011B5173A|nr:right-handed parallel beta-helix repeat-containing protein [Neorhodopirellula pilleata]